MNTITITITSDQPIEIVTEQKTSAVSPTPEEPGAQPASDTKSNSAQAEPKVSINHHAGKMLKDAGIPYDDAREKITPSGKNNTITKSDVEAFIKANALPTEPDQVPPVPAATEAPAPDLDPDVTREDVENAMRRLFASKETPEEGSDAVRALLADFNSPNISGLFPEQYADVVGKIAEMGVPLK